MSHWVVLASFTRGENNGHLMPTVEVCDPGEHQEWWNHKGHYCCLAARFGTVNNGGITIYGAHDILAVCGLGTSSFLKPNSWTLAIPHHSHLKTCNKNWRIRNLISSNYIAVFVLRLGPIRNNSAPPLLHLAFAWCASMNRLETVTTSRSTTCHLRRTARAQLRPGACEQKS